MVGSGPMPDPRPASRKALLGLLGIPLAMLMLLYLAVQGAQVEPPRGLDPAGWGSDHVGEPLPEFTTGDECLFCHRPKDGPGYAENRHVRSLRPVDEKGI